MKLIGIGSQQRMGKNVTADYLCSRLNTGQGYDWWQVNAFASNVKKIYCETFGVDYDFVEKWKVIDEIPPGMDMTVRKALQFIGDGFRNIKSNIWIDLMLRNDDPKIICDVRYINEFKAIKRKGGLNILLARPDKINNDTNGSESEIKPLIEWAIRNKHKSSFPVISWINLDNGSTPQAAQWIDYILINDETIEDLYRKIDYNLVSNLKDYFKGK